MFLLRIVKAIAPEDAEKIRYYATLEKKLKTLADGKFLCQALEPTESERKRKPALLQEEPLVKNLGIFKYPKYEFGQYFTALTYKRTPNYKVVKNLDFHCGRRFGGQNVALEVIDRIKERQDFSIGQFCFMEQGRDYATSGGNIHEIARYFHDKRSLYEKIRALLLSQRQEFETTLNKAFTEDLLALFSVTGGEKKLPKFNIPAKNAAKHCLTKRIVKKNCLLLGNSYYYPKECLGAEYPSATTIELEFFLNTKNQLIINASCGWVSKDKDQKTAIEEIKTSEYFDKFLIETLAGFLQQLVALASFGNEIYEKVKTKILVENI